MIRKFSVLTVLVLSGVFAASMARAQEEGSSEPKEFKVRLDPEIGEMFRILFGKQFKDEFNLTDEQKTKLAEARDELQKTIQSAFAKGDLSDREALGRRVKEAAQEAKKKWMEQVDAILQPEQLKRLKEIRLQIAGAAALLRPEIQKALNLSEEQVSSLKSLAEETKKSQQEVNAEFKKLSPEERQEKKSEFQDKIKEIRKEFTAKARKILTQEQRKQFQEMKGKKVG